MSHHAHPDPAVRALIAAARAEGARDALRIVRLVEADADALTRWSERFRMAFDGKDYRADRIGGGDE